MKLPVSLGIKPALITAAVLLVVIAGMGFKLALVSSARDVAVANQGKAEAARDTAITERDAWKSKAGDVLTANRAYDHALAQLQEAAAEQNRVAEQQAQQAEKAIATSKAKAAAADRELAEFRRLYGKRPADCAAALQSLDRVCPAWSY